MKRGYAAENISKAYHSKAYHVPIIARLDGVGTEEDMAHIKAELENSKDCKTIRKFSAV